MNTVRDLMKAKRGVMYNFDGSCGIASKGVSSSCSFKGCTPTRKEDICVIECRSDGSVAKFALPELSGFWKPTSPDVVVIKFTNASGSVQHRGTTKKNKDANGTKTSLITYALVGVAVCSIAMYIARRP